jgi:hypothetical protein
MKDMLGLMFREAWKEKGRSECPHPDLHKEYSFSGTATGCYICVTCGQLMRMEQSQTEVTRMAPSSGLAKENEK